MSLAGSLTFNPLTDSLTGADGKSFNLKSPHGDELPAKGFDAGEDTYQPPAADGSKVDVIVSPSRYIWQKEQIKAKKREMTDNAYMQPTVAVTAKVPRMGWLRFP